MPPKPVWNGDVLQIWKTSSASGKEYYFVRTTNNCTRRIGAAVAEELLDVMELGTWQKSTIKCGRTKEQQEEAMELRKTQRRKPCGAGKERHVLTNRCRKVVSGQSEKKKARNPTKTSCGVGNKCRMGVNVDDESLYASSIWDAIRHHADVTDVEPRDVEIWNNLPKAHGTPLSLNPRVRAIVKVILRKLAEEGSDWHKPNPIVDGTQGTQFRDLKYSDVDKHDLRILTEFFNNVKFHILDYPSTYLLDPLVRLASQIGSDTGVLLQDTVNLPHHISTIELYDNRWNDKFHLRLTRIETGAQSKALCSYKNVAQDKGTCYLAATLVLLSKLVVFHQWLSKPHLAYIRSVETNPEMTEEQCQLMPADLRKRYMKILALPRLGSLMQGGYSEMLIAAVFKLNKIPFHYYSSPTVYGDGGGEGGRKNPNYSFSDTMGASNVTNTSDLKVDWSQATAKEDLKDYINNKVSYSNFAIVHVKLDNAKKTDFKDIVRDGAANWRDGDLMGGWAVLVDKLGHAVSFTNCASTGKIIVCNPHKQHMCGSDITSGNLGLNKYKKLAALGLIYRMRTEIDLNFSD